MDYQELALRWLHILSAIALVGGTFFWRFALAPSLPSLDEAQRKTFHDQLRPKWARIVMITSAALLISGLWNAIANIKAYQFDGGLYHGLVGVKLLVGLAIMFIAAKLSGRSESAEQFREKQVFWLTINCLLALLLVCAAGVMKVSPHVPKQASAVLAADQDADQDPDSSEVVPAN